MALHPLAAQFASVADAYERGRPDYPPAVIGALAAELGVPEGAPVLDLGAGTGKLSRAVLAAGYDLVAVEPLDSMRDVLAERIGRERARQGRAEEIPLEAGSVAAVTVADAFHWFDQATALAEIRRVLRTGGGLAVISTAPDWSGVSWAHELGTLVSETRPEHPHFDGPPWHAAVQAAGVWTEPREVRITVPAPVDAERILAHMTSISWIAGLPGDERTRFVARLRDVVSSGEIPAELPVHFFVGLASLAR